jgi:ABC-type antimicrobial peptide transport system ATPase subunit
MPRCNNFLRGVSTNKGNLVVDTLSSLTTPVLGESCVGSVVVTLGPRVCGTWIGPTSGLYKAFDELHVHVDQAVSEGFSVSPAFCDPIQAFKPRVAIRKISENMYRQRVRRARRPNSEDI